MKKKKRNTAMTLGMLSVTVCFLFLGWAAVQAGKAVPPPKEYDLWESGGDSSFLLNTTSANGSSPETDGSSGDRLPSSGSFLPNSGQEEPEGREKIDLNTADAEELCELKGIGEVLAGRIIEYRASHGDFQSIEEIRNVSGIGEKKFAAIRDRITVDGGTTE